jgi:hypothetical protein
VDAGIRNSLSGQQRAAHCAPRQRNQLTGRRPSAICSRRVGRAYSSACYVPRSGLASLHRGQCLLARGKYAGFRLRDVCAVRPSVEGHGRSGRAFTRGGRPALPAPARGRSLFPFGARHLPRLGLSTGRNGGRCHPAVSHGTDRLRRWSSLGSRAELALRSRPPRARFDLHARRPRARCDADLSPGRNVSRRLKVCLGGCAPRGGERDLQFDPAVARVFRPRLRGGSCECPFWLGRRERHVGPGRTGPKTGRGSAGWIGGGPGTARDTRTDGLAEMTRSSRRPGEPSKVSTSPGRLRPDSRVVLAVRRFPRAGRSSFSATTLPPTDSRAALSLGHAQHVGHQCRYR